jgi:uncharacterized protein (DUF1697 family)
MTRADLTRYAALLRGINLGSRNRIPMADLRALLSGLGLDGVRTHLQSGNAVFASDAGPEPLHHRIEHAIAREFGLNVACLLRTHDELRAVIAANPLADVADDNSRFMALFLSEAPDPTALARNDPVKLDPDGVRVGDRVIYQWCPNGFRDAPAVGAYVEKHLRVTVTARNWNTVTKLADLSAG